MNQFLIKIISLLSIFLCYFNYSFSIALKEITTSKTTKEFSYKVTIPNIENSSTPQENLFNNSINDFKNLSIDNFLENISFLNEENSIPTLNISSEIFKNSLNIFSIFIQGHTYINNTHGEILIKTYNLDSSSGDILCIENIISNNGIKFLENKIQNNINKNLISKSEEKIYFTNAKVNLKKTHIFFKNKKIIIVFDTYAIGPYSSGTPTFEFNLATIKKYLKI